MSSEDPFKAPDEKSYLPESIYVIILFVIVFFIIVLRVICDARCRCIWTWLTSALHGLRLRFTEWSRPRNAGLDSAALGIPPMPVQPVSESAGIELVSATISEAGTSRIHDNLSASSGQEFNPQNPTTISSSGKQKQIVAEMDEGTSGGRALMPDGFSTPVGAHRPCSPYPSGLVHQFPGGPIASNPIGLLSSSRSSVTRPRSPNASQSSSRSPLNPPNSPTSIASRDTDLQ